MNFNRLPSVALIRQYKNYYTVYGTHKIRGNVPHCHGSDTKTGYQSSRRIFFVPAALLRLPLSAYDG